MGAGQVVKSLSIIHETPGLFPSTTENGNGYSCHGEYRQEDQKLRAILNPISSLKPTWDIWGEKLGGEKDDWSWAQLARMLT